MSYSILRQNINRPMTISQLPTNAIERMVSTANESIRFNLTTNTVQNGDTVYQIDTNLMYLVIDDNNLNNSSGYQVYNGSVYWNNIQEKPSSLSEISENTTHRSSDGTDHANVVLNDTHRITTTGNPHSVTSIEVGLGNVSNVIQIPLSQKGANDGVAELDASGLVPSAQIPSIDGGVIV